MAEWGALLRRCPGQPDRGFKSLPLRHHVRRLAFVAASILGVAIVGVSPAAASTCARFHTAKPNDSWTRLAARFDIPLKSLLALNAATVNTPIFIGDRLCLEARTAAPQQPEPSPEPTPGQSPAPTPERFTRKQSMAIIREVWPDDLEETALFIARRESNFVHHVVGGTRNCCIGLFQIYYSVHRSWLANMGVSDASQLLDPRVNAEAALTLYRRNGNSWRPWWTSSFRP